MRCDECLLMLDEYVEGELDEETAKSLTAHMATCRECAGAHEVSRREQEIYASYLLEVEPPAALWDRLQPQLEKEKAINASQPLVRIKRWLAIALADLHVTPQVAAALVLIIIGLAIGVALWRRTTDTSRPPAQTPGVVGVQPSPEVNRAGTNSNSDNTDRRNSANNNDRQIQASSTGSVDKGSNIQSTATSRVARRLTGRPAVPTVDQVTRRAEQQYLSAIEILSRDIERHRTIISPALLSQLETALADVDRNIAATRRVAREQPGDPFAVQYLVLAYEKKIELLRDVTDW